MASFFMDIQGIKVSLWIKYYEPTRKTGWEVHMVTEMPFYVLLFLDKWI